MCKVGGPRCDGSHTPSAAQRARRKANTAYRNAVADAVLNTTGDDDLARRVKHASMTDLHDIVAAGGYDAEAIAKKCGTATYTSPDGETATVDVVPAGNTRRTPISDETKELLEDIDDAMGSLPVGPYREAVLEGDREGADKVVSAAGERIERVVDEAKNLDVENATDSEISNMLHQLDTLDNYSAATRGYGFELDEDDATLAAYDRLVEERERREARNYAPEYTYRENYGFDEVTPDNRDAVADAVSRDVSSRDLYAMDKEELSDLRSTIGELDAGVREAGGDPLPEHAAVNDVFEGRFEQAEGATDEDDPTVYDDGYLDVDGIANGTITVTPDNADVVADAITDEFSSTDVSGLSDDEFEEFYDRMNTLDDKLRDAGHDGVYELANLADELDYRNQNEDDKYEFGDEYQRQRQLTNWAYDVARDHQPEGMEFGMWRAAQYLENDEYFTGADHDGINWAESVLRSPGAYDKFEVGVAQNVVDKREWKALKSGAEDVSSLSDAQVEDYERRLNDLDNRMKDGDSPLLSTDYESGREVGDLHQRLLEEKLAREERAYERESKRERARFNADKEEAAAGESMESKAEKFWREREERLAREAAERKARGGAGMGGSTFAFEGGPSGNFRADGSANVTNMGAGNDDTPEARRAAEQAVNEKFGTGDGASQDEPEQPEGKTWTVGTVVWAPTKGDTFARVVSLTDKTVTLEEMETSWDAPSGGRQKYSPGAPTGRTYRRQIQRNAAGDMTCKAGPSKSSAMMVEWG